MAKQYGIGREHGLAVLVIGVTLLLGLVGRSRLKIIDVAMLFLLAVVVVAALTRRAPAILSAVLATAAFDFFFVPPYGTFLVDDSGYFFTFAVMLTVASIMGGLTGRIREAAEEAGERERQVGELYALSRDLARETTDDRIIAIARTHLGQAVRGKADLVLARTPQPEAYVAGFGALVIPVWPDTPDAGVAILRFEPDTRVASPEERRTLRLLLDQVAVALERVGAPTAPAS